MRAMRWTLGLVIVLCASGVRAISPGDVIGRDTELSLEDAIELALQRNLELQVARVDPALAEQRVRVLAIHVRRLLPASRRRPRAARAPAPSAAAA